MFLLNYEKSFLPLGPPVRLAQWVGLNQLGSNRPERSLTRPPPRARVLTLTLELWRHRGRRRLLRYFPAASGHRRRRDGAHQHRHLTAHQIIGVDLVLAAPFADPHRGRPLCVAVLFGASGVMAPSRPLLPWCGALRR